MGRSSAVLSAHRNLAILAAMDRGLSVPAIRDMVGLSESYIYRVARNRDRLLVALAVSPLRARAETLRRESCESGRPLSAWDVRLKLIDEFPGHDVPSLPTIQRWIAHIRYIRASLTGSRSRYWAAGERPESFGDLVLIDTASVRVGGASAVLLLMIDHASRVAHAVITPGKNFIAFLPGFVQQWIDMYGVPSVIQSDNGVGFNPSSYREPSAVQRLFAQAGGAEWRFSPVAEAQRNGRVERLVRTIKGALDAVGSFADVDAANNWLRSWLLLYNYSRPHQSLSRRVKTGGYVTPAAAAVSLGATIRAPLPSSLMPDFLSVPSGVPVDFRIVWRRYVVGGVAYIPAPQVRVLLGSALDGYYVAVEWLPVSGAVSVWLPTADGRRLVGSASSLAAARSARGGINPACFLRLESFGDAVADLPRLYVDALARLRAESRHEKRARPAPGTVARGLVVVSDGDGWRLVLELTGEIIFSSTDCGDLDHLDELMH